MTSITPVTTTAPSDQSGAGTGGGLFGTVLDAINPLHNLPSLGAAGLGMIVRAAIGGSIGGPFGMLGSVAVTLAGHLIGSVLSPSHSSASTTGTSAPVSSATAIPAGAPALAPPRVWGAAGSAALGQHGGGHVPPLAAHVAALAQRTQVALAAYDTTAHYAPAAKPGRILA